MWLAAGLIVVLGGCFYVEPINRRPKTMQFQRLCDDGVPAGSCDASELHRGEQVALQAVFNDPDGDERHGNVRWRITACGRNVVICDPGAAEDCEEQRLDCDPDRLFDQPGDIARFTVPQSFPPEIPIVVVELTVFDERGASSQAEFPHIPVTDGPAEPAPLADRARPAGSRDASSPLQGSWD